MNRIIAVEEWADHMPQWCSVMAGGKGTLYDGLVGRAQSVAHVQGTL